MSKGKDISTMFTREENKKNGRLGYCQGKPNWCPLKPLPKKMKLTGKYNQEYFEKGGKIPSYKVGWNDCIDEITRGEVDGEINKKNKKKAKR